MCRHQPRLPGSKKSGKYDTRKKTNKAPKADYKDIKIYELLNKEFKIILKKLHKLQENKDNQQNHENNTHVFTKCKVLQRDKNHKK